MKNGILLIFCLTALTAEINAQDSTATAHRCRTHFDVIAGPNFIRFKNHLIFPSLKYHVGITATRQLKRSSLQAGLQYLPFAATFHDREYYFKFSNHVMAASLMSKLPVTKSKGITIDLGVSYGVIISQWDNYIKPGPLVCYEDGAAPVRGHSILSLQAGASVRISSRGTISMQYACGAPLSSRYYDYTPAYYMLQGSFGYRI